MNTRKARGFAAVAAVVLFLLQGGPAAVSQSCVENQGLFAEYFSNGTYLDEEHSSVRFGYHDTPVPRDVMTLNRVGANFDTANPSYVPGWINALTANDFDLDGWPDYVGTSSSYSNVLAFVKNLGGSGQVGTFQITSWIDGSTGDASGWPTGGVGGAAIDGEGHSGMTSGDYDGDGDFDFVLVVSTTADSMPIKRAWLYENTFISGGQRTGVLGFVRTDLTSAWAGTVKGISWSSTMMVSVKFDSDEDFDILIGNKDGEILKITNTGNGLVNAQTFTVETTPLITTEFGGRGVNTISVADFNGETGVDIIAGSVSTGDLRFYENDGTGQFTLVATFNDPSGDLNNNLYDGAATVSLADDFDRDGDQDLIIGTDNWNYGGDGYGGKCYFFKNTGAANFVVTLIFNGPTKSPQVYDFDLGAIFDFDCDGDTDFLVADGNDSRYYYLFVNVLADVYNIAGTGQSLNLTPTLQGSQYAITRVRFAALNQGVLGGSSTGLAIDFFVSNDDGQTWEFYERYEASGLVNVTNQAWLDFHTYGSSLRWKAVFSATEDAMAEYTGASFETPYVDTLRLEYVYVERREYSRSSAAATSVQVGSQRRKLIISATFLYPGLEGQLRAYDVTGISLQSTGTTAMQTISSPNPLSPTGRTVAAGGSIFWDAGTLLKNRDQADRTIYADYRTSPTSPYQRVDFTEANAGLLGSLLADVNGDNAGLIRFVRGENREWKLGDIQHSNPLVVGPPDGDASVMGAGYADFVQAHAGRTSVVYIGANDGMLHCFSTATGEELWGYIPYNLLPKLKNMSGKDSYTGERYLLSDKYVDASPAVTDAYINGVWKTVLVCGQGQGKGSSIGGGLNYYFALDVTNPQNPLPLWELTQTYMGETWSVPAFGRVMDSSTSRWVAFVGSGYDNNPSQTAGNRFYVVRLDTGGIIRTVSVSNINTNSYSHPRRYTDIYVAIPGSPTAIDTDKNGYTDYVYVGDLDGRLYRMTVTSTNPSNWSLNAIYTDRMNYPIITKPALYADVSTGGLPVRVFFGTGGDDRAPADRPYAFIALQDTGSAATVEWYVGNSTELNLSTTTRTGEMTTGEKIWADPVIADNIVYFTSLKGSIEAVNPCLNLSDIGLFYARFVLSFSGSVAGATALKNAQSQPVEYLQLASKARKAVTIGERNKAPGTYKREVYVQEYDSTIERVEQAVGALLRIVSWREVYKIIR